MNHMSDSPTDEGPDSGRPESTPDLLADALSPVVDPDFDSGSRAGLGNDGTSTDTDRENGDELPQQHVRR